MHLEMGGFKSREATGAVQLYWPTNSAQRIPRIRNFGSSTSGGTSEACVSAQNARRLARLCLSYSTRFLKNFEYTHQVALEELAGVATDKNNSETTRMFKRLLKQL